MEPSASWSRFLERQTKAPPLVFVHGMRHKLSFGVCCGVHSHPSIEIVYHPTGRGITRLHGGREVSFREGDVVVYAPDEAHDQVMDQEGEDLCVQIAVPSRSRGIPESCFLLSSIKDPLLVEELRHLSRGHVHITPTEQAIFNLRATSLLLALLHMANHLPATERQNASGNHVGKAEQYIRDHFSIIGTLSEVADHIGISPDYLRHAFQAERGKSMVRYLNEVRIDRARTLLIHSRIPLKQVATMCGYRDEYYFSAVFQKFAGISPGRYRNHPAPL